MPDESLLTLWREVRGRTLRLTDVTEQESLQNVVGTNNHILWHAGHILCVCDRLVLGAVQHSTRLPETLPVDWWDLFGWNSDPRTTTADRWPAIQDVREALAEQQTRMQTLFTSLTPGQLASELDLPEWSLNGSPVRQLILHAIHDEALHGGEIWLLRKLMRQLAS